MKWLPKEKQNPFIIVVLGTAIILAVIGYSLIGTQNTALSQLEASRKKASDRLESMEKTIKNADQNKSDLEAASNDLAEAEKDLATGDYYSWTYDTMRRFKQPYKLEILDIGHPSVGDVDLLATFPYKQIRFSVNGRGYYHDLGRFLADFENTFPHARVVNLIIDPAGTDNEKLSFRMEIIFLVKSNA